MAKQYITVLKYQDLRVVGIKGMLSCTLEEARKRLVIQGLEVAPVKQEAMPPRDFLAAFRTIRPIVDFTMDHVGMGESAIVAYTLDRGAALNLIGAVLEKVPFSPDSSHDEQFVRELRGETELEGMAYERAAEIAHALGKTLDDVFSTIRYANFLYHYRGVNLEEAQRSAGRRYGLVQPS